MLTIEIPKKSQSVLLALSRLGEEEFDRLMNVIKAMEPELDTFRFKETLSKNLPGKENENLRLIVSELFQIEATRGHLKLSSDAFVELLGEASKDVPEFTLEDRDSLKARTKAYFETYSRPISITSKTQKVIRDHCNIFYDARMMTDIRPVFNEVGDAVNAAVIVHTLVVHYGKDDDHKDFYVALDTGDIQKLEAAIDRAKKKESVLKSLINTASIQYVS